MKFLMIHNKTGSMYYRLTPIAMKLKREGHEVRIHKWNEMVFRHEVDWADVVVLEMVYSPEVLNMVKDMGKVIIYEIDDIMEEVDITHPAHKDMTPLRKKMTLEAISIADIVTVTTRPLRDRYLKQNKNIYVLPNYIEPIQWLRPYKKNKGSKIRIGWGGSISHRPDLEFIQPVIKNILDKNPETKFIYVGDGGFGDGWTAFNYSKDQFSDIPLDRKEYHLGTLPHIWSDKLASLQLDIGIAPLLENAWNSAKSTCKYLEYSVNKIPAVYAKWHYGWVRESDEPYVKDGVTGLLAEENQRDWEEKIQLLINDEKLRKKISDNSYNDVMENYLFKEHENRWMKVYKEAIDMALQRQNKDSY